MFVVDCPYEKREDNSGKHIHKDKAKAFPNKNNLTKKIPKKGLMAHEEYTSDDDDEDTSGEGMVTPTVAIATSSPSKVSLFGAPNKNLIAKCLMAKGINKVTPNIKTTITTTPLLLDCVDDSEVVKVDENEFDKFLRKLKGETKKHFVARNNLVRPMILLSLMRIHSPSWRGIVVTMSMRLQIFLLLLRKSEVFV